MAQAEETPQKKTMQEKVAELKAHRAQLELGGGKERLARQRQGGKKSARDRIERLVDKESFDEIGLFAKHRATYFGMADKDLPADGVVPGCATIDGRLVHLASQDFTVAGGAAGEQHSNKVAEMMAMSLKTGSPFVFINDSGGARVQEGVDALSGYGQVFYTNVMLSGAVPQVSLICGPCAGGAAYSPALTDFIIMAGQGYMFLTGPEVIKAVTGEQVSVEELGGAEVHTARSGVAHLNAPTEEEGIALLKALLAYLPQNNNEEPPQIISEDPVGRMDQSLNRLIPDGDNTPYDIRDAITTIFDKDSFLEIQPNYAANAVIGFARMDGYSVGVVANQPCYMSGALNIDASDKIARFIRLCDAFNVPIVTFVDCPGFLPGTGQEYGGVIRHGAKIIYAYCEATVPKISIVTRKAMGSAYVAMSSRQMRTDVTFSWPTGQIAVMGAEGAVNILFRDEIKKAPDPKAREQELLAEYRERFFNPYRAAAGWQIDEVIDTRETRTRLARALEILRTKVQQNPPKKHGLSPV
jgi:methylmalonyl-CoA carboxyltransferase large subunit